MARSNRLCALFGTKLERKKNTKLCLYNVIKEGFRSSCLYFKLGGGDLLVDVLPANYTIVRFILSVNTRSNLSATYIHIKTLRSQIKRN